MGGPDDTNKLIICFCVVYSGMTSEGPPKISKDELKQKLTAEQYEVCVNKGTEMAFTGKYNDYKKPESTGAWSAGMICLALTQSLTLAPDGQVSMPR